MKSVCYAVVTSAVVALSLTLAAQGLPPHAGFPATGWTVDAQAPNRPNRLP